MRIIRYHEYGAPDVLRVEEAEPPRPGPGQVVIDVAAVGTQFATTQQRRGIYPGGPSPLPGAPGGDVVGTVSSIGPGVDGVGIGDRVAALVLRGAYADQAAADARWLVPLPPDLPAAEATLLASPAQVALHTLRTVGRVAPGESVLVHAAAGAIGHLTVQLARAFGADPVIAAAGSAAKLELARQLGAHVAIDYGQPGWADQVREATGGRGVDVVLDSVGAEITRESIGLLAPLGRLVFYGSAAGGLQVPQFSGMDVIGLRYVAGFALSQLRLHRPDLVDAGARELLDHMLAGRLRPVVHSRLPLVEAAKSHELLESRAQTGKIVLIP